MKGQLARSNVYALQILMKFYIFAFFDVRSDPCNLITRLVPRGWGQRSEVTRNGKKVISYVACRVSIETLYPPKNENATSFEF